MAGTSVAVVHRGRTLVAKGYGKADLEWDVPMPADASFEIGSVTKQFTAAAVLLLQEDGKLSRWQGPETTAERLKQMAIHIATANRKE